MKRGDIEEGAKKPKKKGGGGKLSRSETVTVRLDPKLRFAAELAARKQRRTLSSFIEWAVEEAAKSVSIKVSQGFDEYNGPANDKAFDAIEIAWDVEESEKFAKLALHYNHLLIHKEEVIWKLVTECGYFWNGSYQNNYAKEVSEWSWEIREDHLNFKRLKEYWWLLKSIAEGEMGVNELPKSPKDKPLPPETDEVPF